MSTTPQACTPESLLAHSDWVRRLVGGMVFDPARAEDALQETWMVALEHPPRDDRDLRAWLATVARNAVRKLGRGESRRVRRERIAARLEALPDTVDVIAKARLQRRMVDAVLALDEPYRSTVLLRFFEELPPREIAERLGRPVNTVRTHLERGLAKLRVELDAEYGDREAWGFAFLPLLCDPRAAVVRGSLLLKTGGWIMLLKWMVPAVATLLAMAVWIGDDGVRGEVGDEGLEPARDRLAANDVEAEPARTVGTLDSGRSPALEVGVELIAPVAPAAVHVYAGRLVDITGRPAPERAVTITDANAPKLKDGWLWTGTQGVKLDAELERMIVEHPESIQQMLSGARDIEAIVRLVRGDEVEPARVVTDGSGAFRIELRFPGGDVRLDSEGEMLLGHGAVRLPDGSMERTYVMISTGRIAGRVVDEDGAALAGVDLDTGISIDGIPGFPLILDGGQTYRSWATTSDADGRFRIEGLPVIPGMSLSAQLEGYKSLWPQLVEEDLRALELVMQRGASKPVISGRVVDARGAAVPGASIVLGATTLIVDEHGLFEFETGYLPDYTALVAFSAGSRPAILERIASRLEADPESCRNLVLQLGAPTASITGRVVDELGGPLSGVEVRLVDGMAYGNTSFMLESMLSGQWSDHVVTDASGRFEADGLFHDTYELLVLRREDFAAARLEAVPTGTRDVEIVLDAHKRMPRLTGRVVDRHGRPVPGAQLSSLATLFQSADSRSSTRIKLGETDEGGHFELRDVPVEALVLHVGGIGIESVEIEFDREHAEGLMITVGLLLRFQLDSEVCPEADGFELVDVDGAKLKFKVYRLAVTSHLDHEWRMQRDASPTYEVRDEATEIVFFAGETEVKRMPLDLRYGEVVRVR